MFWGLIKVCIFKIGLPNIKHPRCTRHFVTLWKYDDRWDRALAPEVFRISVGRRLMTIRGNERNCGKMYMAVQEPGAENWMSTNAKRAHGDRDIFCLRTEWQHSACDCWKHHLERSPQLPVLWRWVAQESDLASLNIIIQIIVVSIYGSFPQSLALNNDYLI